MSSGMCYTFDFVKSPVYSVACDFAYIQSALQLNLYIQDVLQVEVYIGSFPALSVYSFRFARKTI